MQIQFNGAAHTVTGSQFLVSVNGKRLLLDCGLFQGRRKDTYEINRNFTFDPLELDAVILSHAHIDHSGNLPNLVKCGYRGPIFATAATADLAGVMLRDSGHIQEADAEYVNKKRARRGEPPVEPLYTMEDAERVAPLFQGLSYGEEFFPLPGVKARLYDAGHILGSAGVALDITENGRTRRLWFSGDIGRRDLPLIRDPQLPRDTDLLMMECTYGDKLHRNPEAAYIEFRDVLVRTVKRGGKVIVPAFAVGRTQEIVYSLHRMVHTGEIPSIPVYVDSPLAVETTKVFMKHPECFDRETRTFLQHGMHPALDFKDLHYVTSVDESKSLNERHNPMVIISASGMAETGRILHHLKNNVENPLNTVMIVSWQAPNTLGRRIADREPVVKIFGEEYRLRAEVATIGGMSAHAGQDLLVEYAMAVKDRVKDIYLVHGEPKAAAALTSRLEASLPAPVHYPEWGQVVEV